MGRWVTLAAAVVVLLIVSPVVIIVVILGGGGSADALGLGGSQCTVALTSKSKATAVGSWSLSVEQVDVARTAVGVVKGRHLPQGAAVIVLAAGLTESGLRNLDYGDRDSLGYLQQRASQGWGTEAQEQDVAQATGMFLDHLTAIAGWQSLPPEVAAQKVQISAPAAYAKDVPEATAIAAAFWGAGGVAIKCSTSAPVGKGVQVVLARAKAELGLPYCWAGGNAKGPTPGSPTNGPNPGPNGLSPGCDDAHPGFDCSGLMMFAYGASGVTLPHFAASQYTFPGSKQIPVTAAAPGDLLFYSSDGSTGGIHHVVMVYAPGKIIEASEDGVPVRIRSWSANESELMPYAVQIPTGGR